MVSTAVIIVIMTVAPDGVTRQACGGGTRHRDTGIH